MSLSLGRPHQEILPGFSSSWRCVLGTASPPPMHSFQVVLGCLSTQSADITHVAAATFNHLQNATLLNLDRGSF